MWSRCGVGTGISGFHENRPYAWYAPCVGVRLITATYASCLNSVNTEQLANYTRIAIAAQKWIWRMKTMRISVARHKRQFAVLPTIGILYNLIGMYSVRIAAMWLFWGISIGIVKNPHYMD